jgi:phospholipase/carboxylesterase
MMTQQLSFIHRFEPATRLEAPPILLLHGTGGDENDLLQLGRMISPGSALLSPRGQVLENGMPRFFRRFAEGQLDEDDLRQRSQDLVDFVAEARCAYGIERPIAVGYSNGANIAAATILLRPESFSGAVLLRPMMPFKDLAQTDLKKTPILIVSGRNDPIVSAETTERLAAHLLKGGARVDQQALPVGHQLSQLDISVAREWIARLTLQSTISSDQSSVTV